MTKAEHLGLEPESMSDDPKHESPADFVVLHSIAISLKRIADAIQGDEYNTGIRLAFLEFVDRTQP